MKFLRHSLHTAGALMAAPLLANGRAFRSFGCSCPGHLRVENGVSMTKGPVGDGHKAKVNVSRASAEVPMM